MRSIVEILVVRNEGVSAFLRKLRHFLRQLLRQISVRQLFDHIVCLILTRVSSVKLIVLHNHGPEKKTIYICCPKLHSWARRPTTTWRAARKPGTLQIHPLLPSASPLSPLTWKSPSRSVISTNLRAIEIAINKLIESYRYLLYCLPNNQFLWNLPWSFVWNKTSVIKSKCIRLFFQFLEKFVNKPVDYWIILYLIHFIHI